MAKPNFTLPNKPAIKSGSILSYNYTDDFTFVPAPLTFNRDSAATRVNEKGLIEDVGYFGPELVQNGDFSQEGSELIVNGGFDSSSNWTFGAGWSINGGAATYDGTGGTADISQTNIANIQLGKTYKVTIDVLSNEGSGANTIFLGGTIVNNSHLNVGSHTFYGSWTNNTNIAIYGRSGEVFQIDNVSVKEVGQDWEFNSTAIITDNGINITTGGFIRQDVVTSGKTYKLTYDVVSYTSGNIRLYDGTDHGSIPTNLGSNTFYFNAGGSLFYIQSNSSNVDVTITNISLIEVLGDKPRIDYSDSLTEPSLLLEPQSTNLLPYSEDFSKWDTNGGTTTTSNASISPDGSNNSTLVVSVGGGARVGDNVSIISGNTYTLSVYLKNNGGNNSIKIGSHTTNQFEIVTINNEWAKYTTTFTANSTVSSSIRILSSGVNVNFYAWGAQLEELPYATSYIPTTGATATRLGETANNAGDVNVFNSEEGVLYVEIAALENGNIDRKIIINDGSFNNQIIFGFSRFTGNINAEVHSGGSQSSTGWGATGITQTNYNKFAICWGNGIMKTYVNGAITSTESNIISPTILNNLDFSYTNNGHIMYGKVKNLKVFNKALTDRELEILTIQ